MTKRDYELIAAVFQDSHQWGDFSTLYNLALDFSVIFEKDNPRFNRLKFLKACGFPETGEDRLLKALLG